MNFIGLLVTLVAAFLLSSVIGVWLIPFLHKLHYGQTILDIGPAWHKSKQGTPTMGGIMFIIGSILACAAGWCTIAFSGAGGCFQPWNLLSGWRIFDGTGFWRDRFSGRLY